MIRKGFALIEMLVVVVIIALAAGGGVYFHYATQTQRAAEVGSQAIQQAKDIVQQVASTTVDQQELMDNALGTSAPAAPQQTVSAPSSAAASVSPTSDSLAGLGSNKYANGILPLGDNKYRTDAPQKGYIYLCNANINGGGAQKNGSWIGTSTWDSAQKISVQGSITWPNAAYTMTAQGTTRVITTNDLPVNTHTGIFPVATTDPAHAIDANPNTIKAQSLSFNLPVHPTFAASPSCISGEVGVMTNGVMLFDGFDAELRDAVAHETQDSCDGHPQESGEYHYHGPSSCLPNGATTVIGFAFDGFPITGAKIADGRFLTTADLDECHGITSSIMLDGKAVSMYHYVMTQDFPYSLSCFRGVSTVKGPTAGMAGGGPSGGATNTTGPTPPAAAIAACNGKAAGVTCTIATPQGSMNGSCAMPPGQSTMACVPPHP